MERPEKPTPLTRTLMRVAGEAGERISLAEITDRLSTRGFGAMMMLLAAPNLLPLPPGSSTFFAVPLILISAQLIIGQPRVWLPDILSQRSLDRSTFLNLTTQLRSRLRRFERLAEPRLWPAPATLGDRLAGLVVLIMALILLMPIPLGNFLPAVAVVITSFALAARDGIWLALGILAAIVAGAIAAGVVSSVGLIALSIFG